MVEQIYPFGMLLVSLSPTTSAKFGFHVASKSPIQLEPKRKVFSWYIWFHQLVKSECNLFWIRVFWDVTRVDGRYELRRLDLQLLPSWCEPSLANLLENSGSFLSVHFKSLQKDRVASVLRMICRELNVRNEVNSCSTLLRQLAAWGNPFRC